MESLSFVQILSPLSSVLCPKSFVFRPLSSVLQQLKENQVKPIQKISLLAAVAAVALCGGCVCGNDCGRSGTSADSPKAPIAKHVVLIGVDGFGARWIPWDKMPNLKALRDGGLYATGRDSYPTSSAINWAQDPSAYTATLFTWDGIGRCQNTNAASFARHFPGPGRDAYPPRDKSVVDEGLKQLAHKPKLILFYQGQVDSLGHGYGWGSEKFTNACVRVDENIGRIVEGVKKAGMWDDTVFMLVADHGGEGTKHGLANLNCFEIPFIVSGAPVKGKRLVEPVLLADTAPTILSILGYEVPDAMRGRNALR